METHLPGSVHAERDQTHFPFPLVASKLALPFARPGVVDRPRVLTRLTSHPQPPVVSVVAPAGYGKSMALRLWTRRSPRPTAWLTLDADDNDPVVLLTYLAAALDRVTPIHPELFRQLAVESPSVPTITGALANAFAEWPQPSALVLDDLHVLDNSDCHDVVATVAMHVPIGAQVALSSRMRLPLPVPRLRAEGRILEIGPDDLAMDLSEAASLLAAAGLDIAESDVRDLVDVTEGWPVAIYLAGHSFKARRGATADLRAAARSRHIAAYAHDELLSSLPDETVRFLTRTAVLDRMSGPLCDAALQTSGSADRLEAMMQSNLLVIPLDQQRTWYRYHHLFRELLVAELERREPDVVPELNRRAGRWCHANDLPDAAVDYAMAAGDAERAALIVQERVLPLYRTGRVATLARWFDWFDEGGHMRTYPGVAAGGAWTAALTARGAAAQRWADAAEHPREPYDAHGADGSSTEGQVALLRALLCRDGADRARTDADRAVQLIPVDSAWRATALGMLGIAHVLVAAPDAADRAFVEAVEVGREIGATAATSVALGQRALLAGDRGRIREAYELAMRACAVMDDGRLQDHVTNVFVFAIAAQVVMREGDVDRTRMLLTKAQRLRPRLTYAMPHLAVQARLALVRTLLQLTDVAGARTVLREVDDILRVRPKLGVVAEHAAVLREQASATPVSTIGVSSLTAAELRLLPLLRTHLTFREIGERLFVSPHTVKTQAISIYRKLGVSSRSDAMRVASEVGLLPG